MAATHHDLDPSARISLGRDRTTDVVALRDGVDPAAVGQKAAALARASRSRLRVAPGFVVTTPATASADLAQRPHLLAELRRAWEGLVTEADDPLIVRSSSTVEDGSTSSMAGRFATVPNVVGWAALLDAIREVVEAAKTVSDAPMAVLVQRQLTVSLGGVLFTADPLTGDRGSRLVSTAGDALADLVGGSTPGTNTSIRRMRFPSRRAAGSAGMSRWQLARLLRLSGRVERLFGVPQDVEWAFDDQDRLWLLQSRPITALPDPIGPVLGPGPVAETFPAPLSPLEAELWLEPLATATERALRFVGGPPRGRDEEPAIQLVGGWAVADLERFGVVATQGRLRRRLDVLAGSRRLGAAWRTGRLAAALPLVARDAMADTDAFLLEIDAPDRLHTSAILSLMEESRTRLEMLHTYELLAGMVATDVDGSVAGVGIALRQRSRGLRAGLTARQIEQRYPVTLTLRPPTLGTVDATVEQGSGPADQTFEGVTTNGAPLSVAREGLRLRIRWLHELMTVALRSLPVDDPEHLTLDELRNVVLWDAPVPYRSPRSSGARPPVQFRRTARGGTVAWPSPHADAVGHAYADPADTPSAAGISAGQGLGPVHRHGDDPPPGGAVLVVDHLDPSLASWLPDLAGIVAATGSPLSHLAILAREFGVPAVVSSDAANTLRPGTQVLVNGTTGQVHTLDAKDG